MSKKEDVVRIAVLLVPFVVHTLEAGGVLLLQVLLALHQLIVGLSTGVFHCDAVGVEKLLPKEAEMVHPFEAQKCGLKAAIQSFESFISAEFSWAELPIREG